jgi:hypothetical protein
MVIRYVALYSEHGPPNDISDRIFASFPQFINIEGTRRATKAIEAYDKYGYQFLNRACLSDKIIVVH